MTPQELKNSILQLAMQGKLVEQRPEEGTAEELYQQIQIEKQKLVKAGSTKKEKPLPEITEDEKPFDIPESWLWVNLDNIAVSGLGKTLDKAKNTGDFQPYLCSINVYWSGINLSKVKVARFEQEELPKYRLEKGDLLICEGGDVGRSAIWDSEDTMYYQNALHRVRFYGDINAYFYKYLLECYKGIGIIDAHSKGMTIKHLVQSALNVMWLPLPPLAEQKRIVDKIEELLPYIDRYEQAWSKLEDFNKRFPIDMQKSILQMAIQGKLVEQRPEEGTAEELYQQIQIEKQKLIEDGTIKKKKPLPEIAEDEKPFDIPESWIWVRLRTIVYNRGQEVPSALFSYIDIGSIDNKNQRLNAEENLIEADKAPSRARKTVELGDILYSTVRPYLHNMCIIDRQFSCKPIASTGFAVMTCYEGIYNKYLFFYLMSPAFDSYANHIENAKGVAYPAINDDRLYRAIVPLPPLAEQQRIVAKLEELLPLCEKLK